MAHKTGKGKRHQGHSLAECLAESLGKTLAYMTSDARKPNHVAQGEAAWSDYPGNVTDGNWPEVLS